MVIGDLPINLFIMANDICYCCNSCFVNHDVPIKCDGCSLMAHKMCSGLSAPLPKCLEIKNRFPKFLFFLAVIKVSKKFLRSKFLIKTTC